MVAGVAAESEVGHGGFATAFGDGGLVVDGGGVAASFVAGGKLGQAATVVAVGVGGEELCADAGEDAFGFSR